MSLLRYLRTVRHLRPEQVYGLWLSHWPQRVSNAQLPGAAHVVAGRWAPPIESPSFQTGAASFHFVAGECAANGSSRWEDVRLPRLWLYNFHYFDDLCAMGATHRRDWHRDLLSSWIHDNPPCSGTGWEPYPTACRIVNWIKWVLRGEHASDEMLQSLALQVRYLRRNMEWRLLANHLFADLKALAFGGCFFLGREATFWREDALRLLSRQLDQQILPDGGHCELSPMYHCIVLTDLLDLINLAQAYPHLIPWRELNRWRAIASRMFAWLAAMSHPDGEPPFFSDGGFTSYGAGQLRDYAARLGVTWAATPADGLIHLRSSGYVRLALDGTVVIFDVGEIGPGYQPGHGHADALSFELSCLGHRFLVNSGTSTYSESPERSWQRGTSAHNTVEIDGLDQSELWAAFRVARRAHPFDIVCRESGACLSAGCAHDGYTRLSAPVLHRRRLELAPGELRITESIEGRGRHTVKLWFHLHPDVQLRGSGHAYELNIADAAVVLHLDPRLSCSLHETTYNPRFGV